VIYKDAHSLDMEQMQWRANKISTYGDGFEWLFDQEYPATAADAFVSPTRNPLIAPSLTARAANNTAYYDTIGAVVIGCDPAGDGETSDRTAIVWRRGRITLRAEAYTGKDEMHTAGVLANYWLNGNGKGLFPDGIIIDKGGLGAGIYARLRELNIPCIAVNFGESAQEREEYADRRTEIWYRMRAWFKDGPNRIPDNEELKADVSAPEAGEYESGGRKRLESKKSMKKRGVRSPDYGDALALTFAEHVAPRSVVRERMNERTRQPASSAGY